MVLSTLYGRHGHRFDLAPELGSCRTRRCLDADIQLHGYPAVVRRSGWVDHAGTDGVVVVWVGGNGVARKAATSD